MKQGLLALCFSLVLLRISAPYALEWAINREIRETEGLYGQVEDVDLHLYRGGYEIEGIQLFMEQGDEQYPLVAIKKLDLSVLWGALFNGHIVAEALIDQPILNLVDRDSKDVVTNDAVKDENTWINLIDSLTPFSIDRVEVVNGEFHFRKPDSDPSVDLFLNQMSLVVHNITNSKELSDTLLAEISVSAKAMGEASLQFDGQFNPFDAVPTFDINLQMERLPISHLDDFIKAYTPFDVEAGSLDLVMELAAENSKLKGYLKPGIYDIDVFDWREDVQKDQDNPAQVLFEALFGGLSAILENRKHDLIATKVELEGQIDSPDVPLVPVILGILKNGLIEAYEIEIDDSVSLDNF